MVHMTAIEETAERREKIGRVIDEAVGTLDAYDSERAREACRTMEEGGETSRIVALPDRRMTFFGSTHTNNPDSQVVADLRSDLRDCLSNVPAKDVSLMIEGRHGGIDRDEAIRQMAGIETVEDAVRRYGEGGVALWVVAEYAKSGVKVEISSPEIPEEKVAEKLRSEFAADDIAAYLMLRQWTSEIGGRGRGEYSAVDFAKQALGYAELSGVEWIRGKKSDDEVRAILHDRAVLDEYVVVVGQQFLDGLNAKLGLAITLEQLRARQSDETMMKTINELSDPLDAAGRHSPINTISARWNAERDRYLVEEIGKEMARGKKPYVIFGASHVTHCEPALQKLAPIADIAAAG